MARGRMLNTTIARDGRLAQLSIEAEYLYLKTIPHLDRDGLIWGEPEVLWSLVCPRRPSLLAKVDALIFEWLSVDNSDCDAPLVIRYNTPQGKALCFPSFAKNQIGLRYDREPASAIPAPPGYVRTADGLLPRDSNQEPDTFRQSSGNLPANGRPEVEVKGEVEVEVEVKEKGNAKPPPPPIPAQASVSSGKRESERMKELNGKLSAELRTPIANVVLDITGKRALADVPIPTPNSERVLADAHDCAVALYGMGYKTESQVLALEPAWTEDWRGKTGGSFAQFVEFASERLAPRNGNGTGKHGDMTAAQLRARYSPAAYADIVQS